MRNKIKVRFYLKKKLMKHVNQIQHRIVVFFNSNRDFLRYKLI